MSELTEAQLQRNTKGGHASMARLTPEERTARGRAAYLAGAVRTVIARIDDLTPEQFDALASALGSRVLR